MTNSVYASVEAFAPMLQMMSDVLDKGAAHQKAKGESPDALVEKKLAPDMFPLGFQVAFACHQVTSATALLQGQAPADFANPETSFADLKATLAKTLAHVNNLSAAAFDSADTRTIVVPLQEPMQFKSNGAQFMRDWLLPTFYFHVVTAYDILRHMGVDIGKRDFISNSAGRYIGPKA
ncbi:MAG TPA: DUF1993 domain-containing protein [Rhizomicrobium sp.]|jgi:hypothetical protein|nr:DUF1993 domain-containing protein [Rhizomicrobium sp.]